MGKMAKSFIFYMKNFDTMETILELDNYDDIQYGTEAGWKKKFDCVVASATNYFWEFSDQLSKELINYFKQNNVEYYKRNHDRNKIWHQLLFFGKTLEQAKKHKWCFGFEINKYNNKPGLFSYILRDRGPTMKMKPKLDEIIGTTFKPENIPYKDCTMMTFHEMPTALNDETEDDKLLEMIVKDIKEVLTKEKLAEILAL